MTGILGPGDVTAARADLAPGGTLRAAINLGNPVLAQRDPVTGQPRGVSVVVATELARRLGGNVTRRRSAPQTSRAIQASTVTQSLPEP